MNCADIPGTCEARRVALTVVLVFAVDPTDVVVVGKLNFAGGAFDEMYEDVGSATRGPPRHDGEDDPTNPSTSLDKRCGHSRAPECKVGVQVSNAP